jgi:hypothetical protein
LQSKLNINKALCVFTLVNMLGLFSSFCKAQIANYISNGSFEQLTDCIYPDNFKKVKYWRSIDSVNIGNCAIASVCFTNVPYTYFGYQFPRTGNNFATFFPLCFQNFCTINNSRGYVRNRLKTNLVAGKTYCVKFYVIVSENSTYSHDSYGIYFGDNSLDTITQINRPLNYLVPQVKNPAGNILNDTLNWTLVTGTFVANGTEKHCVIGNFNLDANVTKTINQISSIHQSIYTPNFTYTYTNAYIDDVSCIPTDLPAFAGADIWGIPSTTVYIGRQRDVGIDEACTWYNMSNTVTPIANAAGLTLTVALSTQTYMVKQDICGIIKYDTVVVYASALGNAELQYFKDQVKVYPQPAKELINLELSTNAIADTYTELIIYTTLGQVIRKEELEFTKNLIKQVDVAELPNGCYTIQLHTTKGYVINQSLLISR